MGAIDEQGIVLATKTARCSANWERPSGILKDTPRKQCRPPFNVSWKISRRGTKQVGFGLIMQGRS